MPKHHSEDYKVTTVNTIFTNLKIYQKFVKYLNVLELVWKGGLIDIKKINQLKEK